MCLLKINNYCKIRRETDNSTITVVDFHTKVFLIEQADQNKIKYYFRRSSEVSKLVKTENTLPTTTEGHKKH